MRDGDNRLSERASLSAMVKNQSPGEKSVQMEEPSANWPWLSAAACAKTSHRMATPTRRRWIKIFALLTLAPPKVTRINCARIRPSGSHVLAAWLWLGRGGRRLWAVRVADVPLQVVLAPHVHLALRTLEASSVCNKPSKKCSHYISAHWISIRLP